MPEVYPRVCGGTAVVATGRTTVPGLSPRVRGNRIHTNAIWAMNRSIPACAGEPRPSALLGRRTPVYPRVCGGTCILSTLFPDRNGLSPRVRGNPLGSLPYGIASGSIPACAGEPMLAERL